MQHCAAKLSLCFILALTGLSLTEWIESPQELRSAIKMIEHDPSTPSPVWVEYQKERFGLNKPCENGQDQDSSAVSTSKPEKVELQVKPNVETTSKRDMTHVAETQADSEDDSDDESPEIEDDNGEGTHFPTMQGFIKFLKSMQKGWLKKSAWSFEKKINFLKRLRDNLMRVIEQQFSQLWQPTERQRRQRRGLLDDSDLDFPPEAAIMSINFLTFAVFLIKLVLQVVQIVKSKHYSFAGFNVSTDSRNP